MKIKTRQTIYLPNTGIKLVIGVKSNPKIIRLFMNAIDKYKRELEEKERSGGNEGDNSTSTVGDTNCT